MRGTMFVVGLFLLFRFVVIVELGFKLLYKVKAVITTNKVIITKRFY